MTAYAEICAGIGGGSLAVRRAGLDWRAGLYCEIDPFPRAVLEQRFGAGKANGPALHGDLAIITADDFAEWPAVLMAGTPCQAFSIAGKRGSLDDARGNLTLRFVELVYDLTERSNGHLRCIVWENVPGVLSTKDNAFGCFLGALVGADDALCLPADGGRWPSAGMVAGPRARAAWRVLDAQHFGVPQRRARVFVVAGVGPAGIDSAEILFERKSVPGDHPPCEEARQDVAETLGASLERCSVSDGERRQMIAGTVSSKWAKGTGGPAGDECYNLVAAPLVASNPYGNHDGRESHMIAHALRGEGFDASEDGTGRGTPLVPIAFDANGTEVSYRTDGIAPTIRAMGNASSHQNAGGHSAVAQDWCARRLTPRECERLQGMPDDHTKIEWRGKTADDCPDGPRYRAIGNAWAVPVAAWILARVDRQLREEL